MTEEQEFLSLFTELLSEKTYSERDVVLIPDTSLLIGLGGNHAWALNTYLKINRIANERNTVTELFVTPETSAQYYRFWRDNVIDEESGWPLAPHNLEDIIRDPTYGITSTEEHKNIAFNIWDSRPEVYKGDGHTRLRGTYKSQQDTPGRVDLSILEAAVAIADCGADVYVASSDIKDITGPLNNMQGQLKNEGKRITPLSPVGLDIRVFKEAGLDFTVLVTAEVVNELRTVQQSVISYPVVIFERDVRCGNATFDVGVGVVYKEYFKSLKLPQRYSSIVDSKRYYQIPVIKVDLGSVRDEKKRSKNFASDVGTDNLLVVPSNKLALPGVTRSARTQSLLTPTFRADLSYLYHHSSSLFADANYVPLARQNK